MPIILFQVGRSTISAPLTKHCKFLVNEVVHKHFGLQKCVFWNFVAPFWHIFPTSFKLQVHGAELGQWHSALLPHEQPDRAPCSIYFFCPGHAHFARGYVRLRSREWQWIQCGHQRKVSKRFEVAVNSQSPQKPCSGQVWIEGVVGIHHSHSGLLLGTRRVVYSLNRHRHWYCTGESQFLAARIRWDWSRLIASCSLSNGSYVSNIRHWWDLESFFYLSYPTCSDQTARKTNSVHHTIRWFVRCFVS